MEYKASTAADMDQVAGALLRDFGHLRIWLLEGGMGVGKTTLVAAIGRVLDLRDAVSSPTFPIIQEYAYPEAQKGQLLVHMDLYRLGDLAEALDAGIEEYLDGPHRLVIEWPELILPILAEPVLRIQVLALPEGERKIVALEGDSKEYAA